MINSYIINIMRDKILLILFCSLLFTNCSLGNDNINEDLPDYLIQWHLIEVNGGIADVSHQFDLKVVIWVFNNKDANDTSDESLTITVTNNNTDDTKEDFLDSGNYNYSITEETDGNYITIEETEFGEVTFPTTTTLLIDTNELSTGSGADGYTYTFQRVLIPVN
tara:strand:+ start:666 stop:1160 length:495 start_codon:yes stop_codon:yes gene_type:complete